MIEVGLSDNIRKYLGGCLTIIRVGRKEDSR